MRLEVKGSVNVAAGMGHQLKPSQPFAPFTWAC